MKYKHLAYNPVCSVHFSEYSNYLCFRLSASVMSAPAALAASKILFPETKRTKTTFQHIHALPKGQEANILDAASQGVASVVILVANIGGSLIAVIGK